MKPKKKKLNGDELYQITPKGLISYETGTDDVWDVLELYCYRSGYNAILINKDGGEFIKVEKEK